MLGGGGGGTAQTEEQVQLESRILVNCIRVFASLSIYFLPGYYYYYYYYYCIHATTTPFLSYSSSKKKLLLYSVSCLLKFEYYDPNEDNITNWGTTTIKGRQGQRHKEEQLLLLLLCLLSCQVLVRVVVTLYLDWLQSQQLQLQHGLVYQQQCNNISQTCTDRQTERVEYMMVWHVLHIYNSCPSSETSGYCFVISLLSLSLSLCVCVCIWSCCCCTTIIKMDESMT